MAKNEVNETSALSKSKQKRAERQKEVKKAKTQKTISKAISIIIALVVIGVFAVAIGLSVYKNATRTQASTEYSKGLTEDGKIKDVKPLDYISLPDYKNLTVAKSEVSATDEEIENDIASLLDSHKEIKDDSSLVVADGDTVNIDYVGSIDGVEFEGGNSNGEGYDLTIGSGQFIEGFEEQLIGHNPGELVVVNVTFPEDYSNEELASKPAKFDVTIHGIYVAPSFTDEFVKENCSENASTTEEYRQYLANNYYDERLTSYITNYINDNTTLNKEPKSYSKIIKSLLKGNDEMTLSYYNQMFSQYGMAGYENLWDLVEGAENEADYEKDLKSRAADSCKEALAYQAIFEAEGLTLDMDTYFAELTEENGSEYIDNMKESYGVEYMAQTRMRDLVVEYLKGIAKVQ